MRVERRRLGTRVRVVLNRTEVRHAAHRALGQPGELHRATRVFLSDLPDAPPEGTDDLVVPPDALERECRRFVAETLTVPSDVSFRVGLGLDGVVGATFQWWELGASE